LKEGVWIKDISANSRVAGTYLAKEKKLLKGKTGKLYLLLRLTDRTGEVEARIWDRVDAFGSRFQAGDLVRVSGEAISYQGILQVKVQDVRHVAPSADASLMEFVPEYQEALQASERRHAELLGVLGAMKDDGLRALVEAFLQDPGLREGWLTAPAAKKLHHARLGGLLEHTLSLCKLVEMARSHYPDLNGDLLLAGAVLHDVGKIRELRSPWAPDYTTEGRLLGHLMMGVEMIEERLPQCPLPEQQAMALKHMVLSHHGQFEYGSPRRPKTLEALVLYMLDDLDAKFDAFHEHLLNDTAGEEEWTSYHSLFDRYLYKGRLSPEEPVGQG
jgi:3'-5' exoribonuclease